MPLTPTPMNPPGTTTIDDPSNEPLYEVTGTQTTNDGRWAHGMVPLNPLTGFPMSPSTPTVANDVATTASSGRLDVTSLLAVQVSPQLTLQTIITVRNLGPDAIDVGPTAGVTSGGGFPLNAGEAYDFRTRHDIYVISADTSTVAWWAEGVV